MRWAEFISQNGCNFKAFSQFLMHFSLFPFFPLFSLFFIFSPVTFLLTLFRSGNSLRLPPHNICLHNIYPCIHFRNFLYREYNYLQMDTEYPKTFFNTFYNLLYMHVFTASEVNFVLTNTCFVLNLYFTCTVSTYRIKFHRNTPELANVNHRFR